MSRFRSSSRGILGQKAGRALLRTYFYWSWNGCISSKLQTCRTGLNNPMLEAWNILKSAVTG